MQNIHAGDNADVDAQHYLASLFGRGALIQSGTEAEYRSLPDETVLKPLLALAKTWLTMTGLLKAEGADASAPRYSGGVIVPDESRLSDEAKAMIAKDAKLRSLIPLNTRLNVITHYIGDLSRDVKAIVKRLKISGKSKVIEEILAASGMTKEDFERLSE